MKTIDEDIKNNTFKTYYLLFGEEGYAIVVKGNPFVDGKESEVAAYLGGRMVGITFRPFSAQILGNPLYEPFEVVMVSDRNGNVYNTIVPVNPVPTDKHRIFCHKSPTQIHSP